MDYWDPVAWITLNTAELLSDAQWGYIDLLLKRLTQRKLDGTLVSALYNDDRPIVYDRTTTMIHEPVLLRSDGATTAFLNIVAYLSSYQIAKPIQFAIRYCFLDKQCIQAHFMMTDALFTTMNRLYALNLPCHDLTENVRQFLYHLFLHEVATQYSIRYPTVYLEDTTVGRAVVDVKPYQPQHIVVLPHQMTDSVYPSTTSLWPLAIFPFRSWGGST